MEKTFIKYLVILLLSNPIFSNDYLGSHFLKGHENKLRQLTMNSLTKITDNIYMINYLNDYYLDSLLRTGNKDISDIIKFAKLKLGDKYNFDIPKLSKGFACSSFNVYNNNNQNLFGRNFDYSSAPTLIVWTKPKKGFSSISFVHGQNIGLFDGKEIIKDRLLLAPYAPMDGLNRAGLAISVLLLKNNSTHQKNPDLKDITTSIMIRGVLDNCKNVKEAITFIKKFNMHDIIEGKSFHFIITDSRGDSVIIEYIKNEMKLIRPHMNNFSNYLYLTNFYIHKNNINLSAGLDRFNIMKKHLNNENVKMEWNEAMNLLNNVAQKGKTLWSNVYNTKKLNVITAFRANYSTLYEFNLFSPMKNIIRGNLN